MVFFRTMMGSVHPFDVMASYFLALVFVVVFRKFVVKNVRYFSEQTFAIRVVSVVVVVCLAIGLGVAAVSLGISPHQ